MSLEIATLGGGCFWCIEAVFDQLKGVHDVVSGYAGGTTENPTYKQVSTGRTGHAEVIQVRFDPEVVSYRDLLRVFFAVHNPTTPNRQGHDVGPQYRSIILTDSEAQAHTAREVIAELDAEKLYPLPIVTEVEPLAAFYPAETEHQEFYARNPAQPYCQAVVAPKVAKFRREFLERLKA